jgi:hypothetical protein
MELELERRRKRASERELDPPEPDLELAQEREKQLAREMDSAAETRQRELNAVKLARPGRFAPAHDRYWNIGGHRVLVPAEERFSQRYHDSKMRAYFVEAARKIQRKDGRILWVTGELELKRKMAKARGDYHRAYGGYPSGPELEELARRRGIGVGEDGRVKVPDFQIVYADRDGNVKTENHEWFSGKGQRLAQKMALGYKIGGISRKTRRRMRARIRGISVGRGGSRMLRDRRRVL